MLKNLYLKAVLPINAAPFTHPTSAISPYHVAMYQLGDVKVVEHQLYLPDLHMTGNAAYAK